MIISISGVAGAGKGTVGRMLAEKLNYKYYSIGDVRRELALKRGMTIEEFNVLGETEDTDGQADEYQKELGRTKDNFVIDGRLSWYFIPQSLKVFLHCETEVASKRIYNDGSPARINQKKANSLEEQIVLTTERDLSDRRRYERHYKIHNLIDPKHFDVYIDDTYMTPEQVVDEIMVYVAKKEKKDKGILDFDKV
ncbi:MAG TPA: (d)CMP kinase [Alphaproteobacteria bacterium]|nr:(d)CMP kinase [Alphaproteobacteria bacterium]